jgi:hypothetical protein
MMRPGHFRWPTNEDIPLFLELAVEGDPVTGATPVVAIRRYKEINGTLLDGYYWDGAAFTSTPTWHSMGEVDDVNNPGQYTYLFEQSLVGLEIQYVAYYKNTTPPSGFATETHLVTNEVYIPRVNPDPIVVTQQTVMGQLELMKDGGTTLFNGDKDSLHFLSTEISRVLGLLHRNSIIDSQQYDATRQLTYARIRVFDDPANVPALPGGNETTGLLQVYEMEAEYLDANIVKRFVLKQVS